MSSLILAKSPLFPRSYAYALQQKWYTKREALDGTRACSELIYSHRSLDDKKKEALEYVALCILVEWRTVVSTRIVFPSSVGGTRIFRLFQ